MFDKDNDGCITREELACVMRVLDNNPTEDEIQTIMNEIDCDGKLNCVEPLSHISLNQCKC